MASKSKGEGFVGLLLITAVFWAFVSPIAIGIWWLFWELRVMPWRRKSWAEILPTPAESDRLESKRILIAKREEMISATRSNALDAGAWLRQDNYFNEQTRAGGEGNRQIEQLENQITTIEEEINQLQADLANRIDRWVKNIARWQASRWGIITCVVVTTIIILGCRLPADIGSSALAAIVGIWILSVPGGLLAIGVIFAGEKWLRTRLIERLSAHNF